MRPLSHSAEPVAPLFHGKQATGERAAALFHVTQSCDAAQPNFRPMSAKTFHGKQPAARMSQNMFHVTQWTPVEAANMFHVTQSCEPAQQRLGLWSEP